MKEFKIRVNEKEKFISFAEELTDILKIEKSFTVINNNEQKELTIKFNEIVDLYPVAIYLLYQYVDFKFKIMEKTKGDESIIAKFDELIDGNDYLVSLISLEIYKYLLFNDLLDEELFLKYNIKALSKELELSLATALRNLESQIQKDNLEKYIKNRGVNFEDYSELNVLYIDNELNLFNKKKKAINISNAEDILGLTLPKKEDDWAQDIILCIIVCSTLKVKKLTIPNEYSALYDALMNNIASLEKDILIVLED